MTAVSVIATVLNERENIARLVESLLQQRPPAAEIVLVDGGSGDGTWEWLEQAATEQPSLHAIRDESCSLKFTPGPVSRGRNVAIEAARSELIACADAGCTYRPDWLAELTAPLVKREAEYALGGACLDLTDATVWDLASAPFFGVKMSPDEPSKSCTARSMAFTKALWRKVGGFPESVLLGDDTIFDLEARKVTSPAFPLWAKARYRPQNSFGSACRQMARYATSDGVLGVRRARLMRNAARCVARDRGDCVTAVELDSPGAGCGDDAALRLRAGLAFFADSWARGAGGADRVFGGGPVDCDDLPDTWKPDEERTGECAECVPRKTRQDRAPVKPRATEATI